MKILQQILDKAGLAPVYKFKVESKSEKGKFHIVKVYKDERIECNCFAGLMKQSCGHSEIVKKHLETNKGRN